MPILVGMFGLRFAGCEAYLSVMEQESLSTNAAEIERQASRTRCIIYLVMGGLMVLPLLVAWFVGAFRF